MRNLALFLGLGLSFSLLAACGRSGLRLPSAGATTGSGGEASSASGSTSTSTATVTVGGSGGSGGAGGSFCGVEPHDTVQIALHTFDGVTLGCATGAAVPGEIETSILGEITTVTAGSITIDSCPPTADCAGKFSKLTIEAPGFHPFLPSSTYVEIRIRERVTDTCVDTVMVRNLPSWEGTPNPVNQGEGMWLAASNGQESFADAPYSIEAVSEGCSLDQPPVLCGKREEYLFRVDVAGSPFDVEMGTAREVGAPAQWVFRNLQSYTSGLCDDVPHFAYWMEVPILD